MLSPYLSKSVLLSLRPRFKYRTLDSFIHYNDDIVASTLKKEFTLKYFNQESHEEDNSRYDFLLRKKMNKTKAKMSYGCYFSNDQPSILRIYFFSQD